MNLHRLHQLDTKLARQLTIALIAVFAVGITILGAVSGSGSVSLSNPDVGTSALLSIGVATASYLTQRAAFRTWRASNMQAPTSSWIGGTGVAAVYTLVTVVAALPVYMLLAGIAYLGGGALHA